MTSLPIEPYIRAHPRVGSKNYDREMRRNERAYAIARHANEMILSCPDRVQTVSFNNVARKSGYSFDQVKDALSQGEGNGLTVTVEEADRDNIRRVLGV